ncbi:CopG family transcriptional regulator [Chloroflexota bacterium]
MADSRFPLSDLVACTFFTIVLSVRLEDEVVKRLKSLAHTRRESISELLKPALGHYAVNERIPIKLYRQKRNASSITDQEPLNVIEEKPEL